MAPLAIWRWTLLGLLKSPLAGASWLSFMLLPLLLQAVRTLPAFGATRAWIFPAGLLGATQALALLTQGESFLRRLATGSRLAAELGALLLACIYLQLPILAGGLLSGASTTDLGGSLPAILAADLHLGGASLLLLCTSISFTLRAYLLVSAIWFLPALCAPDARLERLLALLDAGVALRAPSTTAALSSVAAASAFGLIAYLLRTRSVRG